MAYESIVDLAVSSAVGLVQHLKDEELKEILNDDEKLDALIKDIPNVKSLTAEKEMLLAQNKSLAEFNLQKEPKLLEAREHLFRSYEKAVQLKEDLDLKKSQLDSLSENRSLETTLALLKTAVAEADEDSEVVKQQFMAGSTNSDEFLAEFLPLRTKAHLRMIKVEKFQEIMHNMSTPFPTQTGTGTAYRPQSSAGFTSWNSGFGTYQGLK